MPVASESDVRVPPVESRTNSFIWWSTNSVNGFVPRDSVAKFTCVSCGTTPFRPSNTASAADTNASMSPCAVSSGIVRITGGRPYVSRKRPQSRSPMDSRRNIFIAGQSIWRFLASAMLSSGGIAFMPLDESVGFTNETAPGFHSHVLLCLSRQMFQWSRHSRCCGMLSFPRHTDATEKPRNAESAKCSSASGRLSIFAIAVSRHSICSLTRFSSAPRVSLSSERTTFQSSSESAPHLRVTHTENTGELFSISL